MMPEFPQSRFQSTHLCRRAHPVPIQIVRANSPRQRALHEVTRGSMVRARFFSGWLPKRSVECILARPAGTARTISPEIARQVPNLHAARKLGHSQQVTAFPNLRHLACVVRRHV